jgi:hypothetical protein
MRERGAGSGEREREREGKKWNYTAKALMGDRL